MPNSMIPTDVYTIVNAAAQQIFGAQTTLQAVDTSSFVTVGEALLKSGYENTLNALSTQVIRTLVAIRPYSARYGLIERTEQEFGMITRKISYFYRGNEAEGSWNTDINAEQIKDGQSIDHYTINKQYPLEVQFYGMKVLEKSYTRFKYQLKQAFRSEQEFSAFYYGLAVEINNEIELNKEAENQLQILNHIGAVYNTGKPGMKVNLTEAFNKEFGTTYKSNELRTVHLKEFLAFMVARIKADSDMMERNTELFHLTPVKNDDSGQPMHLLRHTPKSMQRLMMLREFWYKAESYVMPEIFNDRYLKLDQYEGVDFWQSPVDKGGVKVTPNQLNVTSGASEKGKAVTIPYVVGLLYDYDALATAYHVEDVDTTPLNAKGEYYNTFYHWAKDYQDDLTENSILYYMEDALPGG